jgi:predicted TPR repeat methyltransferase
MNSSALPHLSANDPLEPDYLKAEQLLAQNMLKEAANVCQAMLNVNPRYHRGLFLMSKLFSKTGNTEKSLEFIDKAIAYAPAPEASFFYFRGNGRFLKDQLEGAEEDFKKALSLDPKMSLAMLLLGATYIKMKQYDFAEDYLNKARKMGLQPQAIEQLGIMEQSRLNADAALQHFNALIELAPDYAMAYMHRASSYMQKEQWHKAAEDAQKALSLNPSLHHAAYVLALSSLALGNIQQAADSATRAVELQRGHHESWKLLFKAVQANGQPELAVNVLKALIENFPDDQNAYCSMPGLLMGLGRAEEARSYIDKALEYRPDEPSLKHFKAILDGKTPDSADADYVRELFDQFADSFDTTLQQKLDYRTPEILAEILKQILLADGRQSETLSLLDLGCGTGLGAVAMESFTRERVGVDLSTNMLTKAQARGLYSHLEAADIVAFMASQPAGFRELITAVDVLVYIGNLEHVFAEASRCLAAGGYFALSVESEEASGQDFTVRHSGRFAHSRRYIETLAARCGLAVRALKVTALRSEMRQPIEGYVVVLQKGGA